MNTMKDIENLAMQEPIVNSYMQHVHYGNMTMEQALIGMVITLAVTKDEIQNNYRNHLLNCTNPSMIIPSTTKPFDGVGPHPTIAKQINDMKGLLSENEKLKDKLKIATEELEYVFGHEGWVRIRDVLDKIR